MREEIDFAEFHSAALIGMRRSGRRDFRLVIPSASRMPSFGCSQNIAQRSIQCLARAGSSMIPLKERITRFASAADLRAMGMVASNISLPALKIRA